VHALTDVVALSELHCKKPIKAHLAYATAENFVGRVVNGYTAGLTDFALMETHSAHALCEVQNYLSTHHNLGLLIYDAYRPTQAVADFVAWSKLPSASSHEDLMKQKHYPSITKPQLFALQYVSDQSNHCYGHTVDLMLLDANDQPLDLGAPFDFMDESSHLTATPAMIGQVAFENRMLLREAMTRFEFVPYQFEFWHFHFAQQHISTPLALAMTKDLKRLNVKD